MVTDGETHQSSFRILYLNFRLLFPKYDLNMFFRGVLLIDILRVTEPSSLMNIVQYGFNRDINNPDGYPYYQLPRNNPADNKGGQRGYNSPRSCFHEMETLWTS